MLISPLEALSLLEHYKYFLIFPIAIVEGPIIIVLSGFLVSLGYINFWVAYVVLNVADIIGDSMYYFIGKFWRRSERIKKFAKFFNYSEKSEAYLEKHFAQHKIKTFLIAKVAHGIGGSVQIASGIANVKYRDFLLLSLLGTIPKTFVLMIVGFYIGESYEKIDGFFHYVALTTLFIVISSIIFFTSGSFTKKFFKQSEAEEKESESVDREKNT